MVSAASDNSDGLIGALWNIAERSNVALEISMTDDKLPSWMVEIAGRHKFEPWNLFFFWGDWNVAITVPSEREQDFDEICRHMKCEYQTIGRVITGAPALFASTNRRRRRLSIIRNENFVASAYNKSAMDNVHYMLNEELFREDDQ